MVRFILELVVFSKISVYFVPLLKFGTIALICNLESYSSIVQERNSPRPPTPHSTRRRCRQMYLEKQRMVEGSGASPGRHSLTEPTARACQLPGSGPDNGGRCQLLFCCLQTRKAALEQWWKRSVIIICSFSHQKANSISPALDSALAS